MRCLTSKHKMRGSDGRAYVISAYWVSSMRGAPGESGAEVIETYGGRRVVEDGPGRWRINGTSVTLTEMWGDG